MHFYLFFWSSKSGNISIDFDKTMATSTPDGPQRYSRSAVAIEMPATNTTAALIAGAAGVCIGAFAATRMQVRGTFTVS